MFTKLEKLKINIDENQKKLFTNYIELFHQYNSKTNLISKNDEQLLFEKHIYDSLAFNLFIENYKLNTNLKILDIGTGGGFPSLPLALLYKDSKIYALDSIKKKIKFIEETKENLGIRNIEPVCSRAEDLPIEMKESFDIVTSRAMAELRIILEYAIPFLKVGGYFVAYKSIKAEEELEGAKNALKTLNAKLIEKIEYKLPIEEETKRVLLIIRKEKITKNIYPRGNGLIKKKPL